MTTIIFGPSMQPGMGANLHEGGCTFRVWAPNASAVWVAGDFTTPTWDGGKMVMWRESEDEGNAGYCYWSVFVPQVGAGAEYRFLIENGGGGANAFTQWRMDPYCRDATSSSGNSQTVDPTYDWGADIFQMPGWNELVIYEMHIGTFNCQDGKVGTFEDAIGKLDYLRDLGINAIEVMPAEDFDTETSMGYNPALPFAIDDAYGRSKAVQEFVKQAHARGIAVIFDVVYNHLGPEGLGDCVWQFDGWNQWGYGGIYLYNDDRASCAWGEMNRPDFGRGEVRQYLRDNAMMWLQEYQADGLRFDSVVNIRKFIDKNGNDRGDNGDGWGMLQWIANDKNGGQPWKMLIAEDLQNNDYVTKSTGAGGAGFDAQWDATFLGSVRDAVIEQNDAGRDLSSVASAIEKNYNGAGIFQRILYVESHDQATSQRLPEAIWPGNASSWFSRKRSTLGAAVVFASPGIPMIFQGEEFLEWGTWSDRQPLDWSKTESNGGILNLYRDMIKLRRNWYNNTRGLRGANVNVFHVNNDANVIAFHRWMEGGPGDDVIVVANFSGVAYPNYNIGFPREGPWYLRFNSDWSGYWSDYTNVGYDTQAYGVGTQGMPCNGNVGIGAYSVIMLSQ